jgi:hypothetical protein
VSETFSGKINDEAKIDRIIMEESEMLKINIGRVWIEDFCCWLSS